MNLNSIDLNILKHLSALLEEKSVSNAAKKVGVTQPAMSKSLKKIRDILSDEILIENGSGYSLTEKAKMLQPKVESILKSMDSLLDPCESFNPEKEEATIKIVSSDYGNLLYLPKILNKLKKYPKIKVEVYSPQEQDLNRLQEEDVDFYFGIGKVSLLPEKLVVKKIFNEQLKSAVCVDHPLSGKDPSVEDFTSFPHMLISNLNLNTGKTNLVYSRGIIDEELDKQGFKREVSLVVPHFSTAPLLLKGSSYILSAPARLIDYYKDTVPLFAFSPPLRDNPQSEFYMAWHKLSLNKRANEWFKTHIVDSIKE